MRLSTTYKYMPMSVRQELWAAIDEITALRNRVEALEETPDAIAIRMELERRRSDHGGPMGDEDDRS
jgi:hypothetical protein